MKIAFANQLRGIAALMVLINHYYGSFFWDQGNIASTMHSPAFAGTQPWIVSHINLDYFCLGPLGVSIFFLISGFVIPFSLDRLNGSNFLKARLIRIYPTYWIGLILGLVMVAISGWYWGNTAYPFSVKEILSNLTLCNLYYGQRGIDFVNWTLAIEIKFYLIAWLLAPAIRSYKITPLLIFALLVAVGNVVLFKIQPTLTTPNGAVIAFKMGILLHELLFVAFMFLGTTFYYHFKQKLTTYRFFFTSTVLVLLIALAWRYTMYQNEFPGVSYNYLYGLVIFSMSYFFRDVFRPNRIIDFFADISYPLYIIHALVGFCLIEVLTAQYKLSYSLSAFIAFMVIILFAYLLHRYIETYFIKLGKKYRTHLPASEEQFYSYT